MANFIIELSQSEQFAIYLLIYQKIVFPIPIFCYNEGKQAEGHIDGKHS